MKNIKKKITSYAVVTLLTFSTLIGLTMIENHPVKAVSGFTKTTITGVIGNHSTSIYSPDDGCFYMLTENSTAGKKRLYSVDYTTGTATLLNSSLDDSVDHAKQPFITSTGALLFCTDDTIFRTTDGGVTITIVATGLTFWNICEDTTNNILYATNYRTAPDEKVYRSLDDGVTWSSIFNATAYALITPDWEFYGNTSGFDHPHQCYYDNDIHRLLFVGGDGAMNPHTGSDKAGGIYISDKAIPTSEADFDWYEDGVQYTSITKYNDAYYLGYDGDQTSNMYKSIITRFTLNPVSFTPVLSLENNYYVFNIGVGTFNSEEIMYALLQDSNTECTTKMEGVWLFNGTDFAYIDLFTTKTNVSAAPVFVTNDITSGKFLAKCGDNNVTMYSGINFDTVRSTSLVPGGGGTYWNSYKISKIEHLNFTKIAHYMFFDFTDDLDFNTAGDYVDSATYKTIYTTGTGWLPRNFQGVINGNNHTLSNLFINRPTTNNVGLIAQMGGPSSPNSSARLSNLGLIDVNVTGKNYTGALSGYSDVNWFLNNTYVDGGRVNGTWNYVGGMGGYLRTCYDCWTDVNVTCRRQFAGGFVGTAGRYTTSYSRFTRCHSLGDVNMRRGAGDAYGGGFAGAGYASGSYIRECYSSSRVASNNSNILGGFIAYVDNNINISDCYAQGNVSAVGNYAGGFIATSTNPHVGVCSNCWSSGAVTGSGSYKGGFAGRYCQGFTTDCFWDNQTSGKTVSNSTAVGKNTANMTKFTTFDTAGWDISLYDDYYIGTTWYIDNGSDYPRLGWEYPNNAPVLTSPYPADGETEVNKHQRFRITAADTENDTFNLTWMYYDGSWHTFKTNTNVNNGTYISAHQDFYTAAYTDYLWCINAEDEHGYTTNETYVFTSGYIPDYENEITETTVNIIPAIICLALIVVLLAMLYTGGLTLEGFIAWLIMLLIAMITIFTIYGISI